jgi:integrase
MSRLSTNGRSEWRSLSRSIAAETPRRRIVLPCLELTEVTDFQHSKEVILPLGKKSDYPYFAQPLIGNFGEHDGEQALRLNRVPVVLSKDGSPWAEANVYLLSSRIEGAVRTMGTYWNRADDLAAFRQFLDEEKLDWRHFPQNKLSRVTYRFNAHLRISVQAGSAATTARRRMISVIYFYKWLQEEGVFSPEHAAWKESERLVGYSGVDGQRILKRTTTTDLSIKVPPSTDPYAGTIDDGGKLRPLSEQEQVWLTEALERIGNTEMSLVHLLALTTGARMQTALTLRVSHALIEVQDSSQQEVRIAVGPGTGIDTKRDKPGVLHIPVWLQHKLRVYALSERARHRRHFANGGDTAHQYLFLSVRGAPLYLSKEDASQYDPRNAARHMRAGQAVRQFITERVIPEVRGSASAGFHYRFHDLRATFGMNLTDQHLVFVARGEAKLHHVRELVKVRMGHASAATTDRYLQYRSSQHLVRQIGVDYHKHLRQLSDAISGELP